MKVIRYSFSGWHRRPVPPELNEVRPFQGNVLFYTIAPEEGGENVSAPVVEEVTLADLLQRGKVWAADAYHADAATRGVPGAIEEYARSIVQVRTPEDLPLYAHRVEILCPCECGDVLGSRDLVTIEIMLRPTPPEPDDIRPWCPARVSGDEKCLWCFSFGSTSCPWW